MKKYLLLSLLFTFGVTIKGYSVVPVEDFVNLPHNVLTGVNTMQAITETIKSYKLAMDEYKLMVKNMAAPYFWVFNEVNNFEKNIDRYKEKYKKYGDKDAWAEYFATFIDPATYASSQCFKFGGCSPEENAKIRENRQAVIANAGQVTMNFTTRFKELSDEYKKRINILDKLAKETEKADGNIKQQAVINQYLHALNESNQTFEAKFDAFLELYSQMAALQLQNITKKNAYDTPTITGKNRKLTINIPQDSRLLLYDYNIR